MWQSSNTIRAGQMLHIALCCLEGSTPSNLVHRRRRCARIGLHSILLPGGQYARGQVSHQAKDIIVAPAEPFCTAKGSYFVLMVFCLPMGRPDGWGGSDREARLHD